MNKLDEILEQQNKEMRRDSRAYRDNRDSRSSRYHSRKSYRSDTDSSSENDRYRSRSRGRISITCAYCHKPNHDVSHCYKMVKDMKKLFSGELKIDEIKDQGRRTSIQMLIDMKNYYESKKGSTN